MGFKIKKICSAQLMCSLVELEFKINYIQDWHGGGLPGCGLVESEFSDCLWLSFILAFAKPNNS